MCMADKALQLTEHGSIRGAIGGRSTQQKSLVRGQGTPQGPAEVDCVASNEQPLALPPKAVLGRSTETRERQKETCSPCCDKKVLHTQAMSAIWPWDAYISVNSNEAPPAGGEGHVGLQERLVSRGSLSREEERTSGHGGLCCPSKILDDPAASPAPWSVPESYKLPGTLRSWTSTVSR